jgi:hypothetical protein
MIAPLSVLFSAAGKIRAGIFLGCPNKWRRAPVSLADSQFMDNSRERRKWIHDAIL